MLGFNNKKDNEQSEKLANFLDICSFIETFKEEIRFAIIIVIFALCTLFKITPNWFLRIIFSGLLGNLIFNIFCCFTIDKQYSVVFKKLKYPLIVKGFNINEEDKKINLTSENPTIPGIDFSYEIKEKTDTKFAVAFQVDDKHYKILTPVDCPEISDAKKKITSEILINSFDGLQKNYIYSNQCLVFHVLKLKKEVDFLEIINTEDIDETLIVTECVYYPYIK